MVFYNLPHQVEDGICSVCGKIVAVSQMFAFSDDTTKQFLIDAKCSEKYQQINMIFEFIKTNADELTAEMTKHDSIRIRDSIFLKNNGYDYRIKRKIRKRNVI